MRTPYSDGMIAPRLLKKEAAAIEKLAKEILVPLGTMSPIDKKLSEAAQQAATGLATVMELAGPKPDEDKPILDEIEKKEKSDEAAKAANNPAPADTNKPATPSAPAVSAPPAAPPAVKK